MDLIEIGRMIGKVETDIKHLHGDVRAFIGAQEEKNVRFEEAHVFVHAVKRRRKWLHRLAVFFIGLFAEGSSRH